MGVCGVYRRIPNHVANQLKLNWLKRNVDTYVDTY
jgi:hypothetical protein